MDQMVNIGSRSTTKVVFLKSSIFIRLTWNLKRFIFHANEFNQPIIYEVNIDQMVNIGPRSSTKVVFLKSSIFIRLTRNLKRIYISGQWIQRANYFWGQHQPKVNISPRSTTSLVFLKSPIFIRLTWNLKRIYISGHWIQPPIIFEVIISQKNNRGQISKIVNFHPIHLKFEYELHIWSLNSTSNYFWGQICFMDFASIMHSMASSSYLFVCVQDISNSCWRILTKLGGEVWCITWTNWFNFVEDPNPDPGTRIF